MNDENRRALKKAILAIYKRSELSVPQMAVELEKQYGFQSVNLTFIDDVMRHRRKLWARNRQRGHSLRFMMAHKQKERA